MTMGKEEEGERAEGFVRAPIYSVIHLPVVDVMCVLFWTQSVSMVKKQNTRNIYHKRMKDSVRCPQNCFTLQLYLVTSTPITAFPYVFPDLSKPIEPFVLQWVFPLMQVRNEIIRKCVLLLA